MSTRWLTIIILFAIVVFISFFAWNASQIKPTETVRYEISNFKLADFNEIQIDFPSRVKTHFKIIDGHWRMLSPHKARADELYVYRILSILATSSSEKLSSEDLDKYGLDKPTLKITLSNKDKNEVILFGTYNPVNEDQYVMYNKDVYLISGGFSETASFVPTELIDKKPIAIFEKIYGFDFSRLEQWQANQLKLSLKNNKWTVIGKSIEVEQAEMLDWLDITWGNLAAEAVEPYEIDSRVGYKSFNIVLNKNKKIIFYRIQESPKLKLFRKDEGLIYTFPGDLGFTMLNPHVKIKEEN